MSYVYVSYIKIVLYLISIVLFYPSISVSHIKKKCVDFLFFEIFWFLDRTENTKRPVFYTLLVTRVFPSFPQLKQLNKIKNA